MKPPKSVFSNQDDTLARQNGQGSIILFRVLMLHSGLVTINEFEVVEVEY